MEKGHLRKALAIMIATALVCMSAVPAFAEDMAEIPDSAIAFGLEDGSEITEEPSLPEEVADSFSDEIPDYDSESIEALSEELYDGADTPDSESDLFMEEGTEVPSSEDEMELAEGEYAEPSEIDQEMITGERLYSQIGVN